MSIDLAAVRADTPACKNLLHFNNAGASLTPQPVYDTVIAHLDLERRIGAYEAEEAASETLEDFYDAMAEMLSCHRDEIAYIENATRAWDMAFYSLPLEAGDQILTHSSEYASNYLAYLQQARRRRLKIEVVPSDRYGQIDVAALESMINEHTRLISINHVPTQSGLVNPAEKVGEIASKNGIFYLLDACQADRWLKGAEAVETPLIRAYMMDSAPPRASYAERPGRWIAEDAWPSANVRVARYALNPGRLEPEAAAERPLLLASPQDTGAACGEYCAMRQRAQDSTCDRRQGRSPPSNL